MAIQQAQVVERRTRAAPRPPRAPVAPPDRVLPLVSGDRLTRREFERRYEAMPHVKKAELIEGVVYMPSPVSASHSKAHGYVMGWLSTYCAATPRVALHDNAALRLDLDNEVQPDALLRLEAGAGGNSRIAADDYVEGAPELVVEVAASSAAIDLHDKLRVYRRNGVQEYVVWQIYDERLDWFVLQEGEYVLLEPDAAGLVRSQVFPGLWLAVSALLAGDLAVVIAELQPGLEGEQHAAFVEALTTASQEGNRQAQQG
jgi:Uma2 family endonuclease